MSFLSLEGTHLHYQVLEPIQRKPGVTIVFLHGLVMDNLSSWFFTVANPAAQACRVLLYDLRGHGMSDRPASGYSIDSHVADLKNLIDHAAADDQVILVGNSFGGLLALNFATQHPERVAGLVLVDAQINDQAWRDDMLNSLRAEDSDRRAKITVNFQNWLGRASARKSNRLAKNAYELVDCTSLIDELCASAFMQDTDLQHINVPVVAIYGENSDIIGNAERLRKNLPQCEVHVLAGCTHSVLWEQTERLRDLIIQSLQVLTERRVH